MKEGNIKITKKIINSEYEVQIPAKLPDKEIDFVSLTAHQLRNPLSSMKLSLEMLLDGDFGKISDEQKDIITKVLQMNRILIFLVKDLLDLSKVEEKDSSFHLTPVDIQDLVEFIISFTKQEIKKKKIKFTFKQPNIRPPKIMLDKEKMYLAIQNIIDNAIKYTKEGGEITIFLNADSKELEFKIQDSGIGISPHEKEKLFTKFFRGDNAIKTEAVGSGLGLFITKNIIEGHRGRIWCESPASPKTASRGGKENPGSCFFFTIPIH